MLAFFVKHGQQFFATLFYSKIFIFGNGLSQIPQHLLVFLFDYFRISFVLDRIEQFSDKLIVFGADIQSRDMRKSVNQRKHIMAMSDAGSKIQVQKTAVFDIFPQKFKASFIILVCNDFLAFLNLDYSGIKFSFS